MQVEKILTFAEYWNDQTFRSRRPDRSRRGDNIYKPSEDGGLSQVPNDVHDPSAFKRDTSGAFVLVSQRFWYFGESSPPFAPDLSHLLHRSQGHSLHVRRRDDDERQLLQWLNHWKAGVHGYPIDLPVQEREATGTSRHKSSKRC